MNWTNRRPFKSLTHGTFAKVTDQPMAMADRHERCIIPRNDKPIDALRLQLADINSDLNMSRRHYQPQQITTFSDHNRSLRRSYSSVQSISTLETDFLHQVSTIRTYPSSISHHITEQNAINPEGTIENDYRLVSNAGNNNIEIEHRVYSSTESIHYPSNAVIAQNYCPVHHRPTTTKPNFNFSEQLSLSHRNIQEKESHVPLSLQRDLSGKATISEQKLVIDPVIALPVQQQTTTAEALPADDQ
ncbi:unnamed protein product, partial [Didymodactylos carnosus]